MSRKQKQSMSTDNPSYAGWLGYPPIHDSQRQQEYAGWCGSLMVTGTTTLLEKAKEEWLHGITSMLGETPKLTDSPQNGRSVVMGTTEELEWLERSNPSMSSSIDEEGFALFTINRDGRELLVITGRTDKGVLYGVFHLLRMMQSLQSLDEMNIVQNPRNALRMMNQWDNIDGSIERGYAGRSIFYENNEIVKDLSRIRDYARLLASVQINAISINNVNVHQLETYFITDRFLPQIKEIAAVFREYGIKLFLSINYAAPISIGKLPTADPLDEQVKQWWKQAAETVYSTIPDFGGFLVKADSENRPGPFTYDRNHDDGANMLADALAPYGGLVIWRCFVYNCHQDWRDRTTDRARAAYDHFMPLDGKFKENVILQIKNGPMDFQVREPVSPLFGGMEDTNQVLEFQITQEYTGQQRHLCYLVPQWKEVLNFDTHAKGQGSTVQAIADGSLFHSKYSGFAAVSNIGRDMNWTGHSLAQANFYGYGRLAWDPELSAEQIADEWIRMTFGRNPEVMKTLRSMMDASWKIYENYTAPLGVGWMVNPSYHYGPNVDGYEYSKWGTYHFADCHGIGVDRTVESGTGYTEQYHAPVSEGYESLEQCPDELLLFFHHVPYTHQLHSGKTVIQHIYDTHFEGVEQAEKLLTQWGALEGQVDEERFEQVNERLQHLAEHAKEWRDMINTYFYRKSGICDERGRTIY